MLVEITSENRVEYVIFLPTYSPPILSGVLTIEDFLIYLNELEPKLYK
jgi:hypothetical protein